MIEHGQPDPLKHPDRWFRWMRARGWRPDDGFRLITYGSLVEGFRTPWVWCDDCGSRHVVAAVTDIWIEDRLDDIAIFFRCQVCDWSTLEKSMPHRTS